MALTFQQVQCLELLIISGASTHRVEQLAEKLCLALGMEDVQVALFPSMITVTFNGRSDTLVTRSISRRLVRGFSLNRMEAMDAYLEAVCEGRIPSAFLKVIAWNVKDLRPQFNQAITWIGTAFLNAAGAVTFFGQGWQGAGISGFIGLAIIGPLTFLARKMPNVALLLAPAVAFVTGFVVRSAIVIGLLSLNCLYGTHLSAVVSLAPGIPLATAALELASKSIVSGSSRLISALVVAFSIGLGLTAGDELARLFDPNRDVSSNSALCMSLSLWWLFLSFPILCVTIFILLDAPFRRWPAMTVAACSAFFGALGLSKSPLTSSIQSLIAAFFVAILGSLYAWLFRLPSSTFIYAGITFLVPGSLAILTLHESSLSGVLSFGFSFLNISISISIGILIASVPSLHSTQSVPTTNEYLGATSLI